MEGSYEMGSPRGGAAQTARQDTSVTTAARVERGDRVVITGASGFIGSAVVRAMLARGAAVVAAVEPEADDRNLKGIDTERAVLDIRDLDAVRAACKGARFVIHLAAVYRFWARDPKIFYEVNVGGTLNVLDAAAAAGCERLVFTSTVGVLGLEKTRQGQPADETSRADLAHLFGHYKRSKFVAEHEVLRAAPAAWTSAWSCPPFRWGPGTCARHRPGRWCSTSSTARCPGSWTPP